MSTRFGKGLALTAAITLAATLGGCSGGGQVKGGETGKAEVNVTFAVVPADIGSVRITISGGTPMLSTPIVTPLAAVAGATGRYAGLVTGIPAGTGRVFLAEALNATGAVIYRGQATVAVVANQTAQVSILAQEVGGGGQTTVWVPVIDSLTATATQVEPGLSVGLAVAAHSPYNPPDTLSYLWSATCSPGVGGNGTFTNGTTANATWLAPNVTSDDCLLSVAIMDQHSNQVSASLLVAVRSVGVGDANVTVYANTWPIINAIATSVSLGTATTNTVADFALQLTDPDGDMLSFTWSDGGCGGTFTGTRPPPNPIGKVASWSGPSGVACTITVTAADQCTAGNCPAGVTMRGGSVSAAFRIPARPGLNLTGTPGAPTSVAATLNAASDAVVVTFSPPADPGSGAVTGYTVTSSTVAAPTAPGPTAIGTASPITVPCVGPCSGLRFAVAATNASGTGAASALADVLTQYDVVETFKEPMTQPYNSVFTGTFTLNSSTRTVSGLAGSLTQSMTPAMGAVGGVMGPLLTIPLANQLVALQVSAGSASQLAMAFHLNSLNTFAPRPATPAIRAPFDVADPTGLYAPGGTMYFGYPTATNPFAGGVGNAYALVYVNSDNPTAFLGLPEISRLAYADCTANGMMGAVCMTGTNMAGYGRIGTMQGYPVSQVVTRRGQAPVPALPDAPTGVAAVAASTTSVNVSWTAPATGGPAAGYFVEYKTGTGAFAVGCSTAATSCTVQNLIAATTYDFRVTASNAAGIGLASGVVQGTTSLPLPPGTPTGFAATATSPTAVNVSWTAPAVLAGSTGAATGYLVQYREGANAWVTGCNTTTATSCTVQPLLPATTYGFQVTASNAGGSGPPTNQVNVTTPAQTFAPGAPTAVAATLNATSDAVVVSFSPPASDGGSAITGYTVTSSPAGLTATAAASPITVSCGGSCAGRSFAVAATNANGTGPASAGVNVVTSYSVVETFFEPQTQPNDSIFTGTFTLDSTTRTVTGLQGSLTESMTLNGGVYGPPMTTVSLVNQLSSAPDGLGGNGLLVATFRLNTVDTFFGGGFAPGTGQAIYFGFPASWNDATANAYAMIHVNTDNPTTALVQAQIDRLAYADCAAGGMMAAVCMTGTTVAGYGVVGSMGGYPVSQVITRLP